MPAVCAAQAITARQAAIAAFSAGVALDAHSQAPKLKVGLMLPYSGTFAALGTAIENGFRLYIAGEAVNSTRALANLQALCREHLAGHHSIEVVDVFREPGRALADAIFMTPTLLRLAPAPLRKIGRPSIPKDAPSTKLPRWAKRDVKRAAPVSLRRIG